MYRSFPIGYLLFCEDARMNGAAAIGTEANSMCRTARTANHAPRFRIDKVLERVI
jgi:hypothetical protein